MAKILKVAFKALTAADFIEINKRSRGGGKGGGQSYIDFQTREISDAEWNAFFSGAGQKKTSIPQGWLFDPLSLGTRGPKLQTNIELSYRDDSRLALREQKHPDFSKKGNRLFAWRPEETGFPKVPTGATEANQIPHSLVDQLRIFLVRDDQDHIWAGWRKGPAPSGVPAPLDKMFTQRAGMIEVLKAFELDATNPHWPFSSVATSEGPSWDDDDELDVPDQGITYSVQKIRKRNKAAADSVRSLYPRCQITGNDFLFTTRKGRPYLEVHHLIPLGKGGADAPHNMVVLSAHAHKMLHHADVSAIDLSKISNGKLAITINGSPYNITWHPRHAARVLAHNQP